MLIVISCLIFFSTAFALVILKIYLPDARYAWLVAVSGAILALVSVFIWLAQTPFGISLPAWQPQTLFINPISFRADGLSWPYAVSISALVLAIMLTAVSRPVFVNSYTWAGTLALGGLGLLAVTADNPLTLLLVWAALDITELVTQLRSVDGPANNEKVVIAFSTRALGSGLLLWANIISISTGSAFNFVLISPQSGLYLIAAAGLRLGVLPLHLPYSADSNLRRGFGTSLRFISAASSLVLLAHVPSESLSSSFTPVLMALAIVAATYGGWMWLRAPDELNGRPFWVIGIAALSVISALSGNSIGAVAWGCALILTGGALFLSSVQHPWLNRAMLVGVFSLSTLPFSLTAGAWLNPLSFFAPFVIAAQALLTAGFVRHALRPSGRDSLESQPSWTHTIYPSGIILMIVMQVLLGLIGWNGVLKVGAWVHALLASLLTVGLVWATPRFRILNPVRAHWVTPSSARFGSIYEFFWGIYQNFGRLNQAIIATLEGDGGIMWTLLFLVLLISLLTQGAP